MPMPTPTGRTLRDIAQERNINVDWNRLNSREGGGDVDYRRSIFDQLNGDFNPYGTLGATGLDQMGRAGEVDVTMIPDDIRGTKWESIAQRLGATDSASLRGMVARGRGNELWQGDRGDYNEFAADLGNLVYDPDLGWIPGEGGFNQGDKVGESFSNMRVWGPLAVLAAGGANNLGLFGGEGAGVGGGVGGGGGGAVAGDVAATGAFDTAGWAGTGINGATGVNAANAAGFSGLAGGGASGLGSVVPSGGGIAGTSVPTVGQLGANAAANVAAGTSVPAATSSLPGWATSLLGSNPLGTIASGISLVRGLTGSGAGTAEGAQQAGQDAANAADPFRGERQRYQDMLRERFNSLTSFDPTQIQNDPAYQFRLQSGTEAIDRAAAAGGMFRSGNRGTDLARFGQNLATEFTQQQFTRNQQLLSNLMGLSGATSGSPAAAGQAIMGGAQGAANLTNNNIDQMLALLGGRGGGTNVLGNIWDWLTS